MKNKALVAIIIILSMSACTPYGHWGRYDHWLNHCPGFPSREIVEQTIKENESLLNKMLEENLIYKKAQVTPCPTIQDLTHTCYSGKCDGAFITLYSKSKSGAIKMLDEANARTRGHLFGPAKGDDEGLTMFYGVPFRFARD